MTEDYITEKTHEIYQNLSIDAKDACSIFRKYNSFRIEYNEKNPDYRTFTHSNSHSADLEKYCKAHPEIRSEIQNASAQIKKLIQQDIKESKAERNKERRKIEKRLEDAKRNSNFFTRLIPKFFLITGCISFIGGILALLTGFICYMIRSTAAVALADSLVRPFWICVIIFVVSFSCIGAVRDKIQAIELELHKFDKENEDFDKSKRLSALRDEQMYDIILDVINGTSLKNINFV